MPEARPDYRSVKDVYDELKDAGVVSESLPEWSDRMNRVTKTDLFAAGLHDNIIKRAIVAKDRLLESTGLPNITEAMGGNIGEALGAREAGARIGKKLPSGVLNMASFLIPGGGWANAARLGIAGLMSGAETYTETGSPAAGVISGLTSAALPKVADIGEQFVAKKLGARLVAGPLLSETGRATPFSRYYPETVGQKVGTFLGGQVTAAGFMEGTQTTSAVLQGETPTNPFSVENLLNYTLGQVPFAAIHGANKALGRVGPSADTVQHAIEKSRETIDRRKVAESITVDREPPTPEVMRETQQRLAQLRGEQVRLDPTNIEEANRLLQEEHATLQQHVPTAASVFGDTIAPDSPREQVVGRELKSTDKWRAVMVDDIPANPPDLRGKIVTYSTAYEPNPTLRATGDTVFGLPNAQWRTIKSPDEWNTRKLKVDPNQPDLPQQENPATEFFSHLEDLKKVSIDVDSAQTPAEMQQAVVRLQGVQNENDIPPTNDATIKPLVEQLTREGVDQPVKTAVKIEAKRTGRRLQATKALPLSEKEAADISAKMGQGGFSVIGPDKLSHVETKPFGDQVTEAAYNLTEADVKAKRDDVNLFRTIIDQLGTLPEVGSPDITEVAQYVADRDGVPLVEAKDEVNALLTQPHVQEWGDRLNAQMEQIRQNNLAPDKVQPPPSEGEVVNAPNFTPFIPNNPADIEKVQAIGTTGESLHAKLKGDNDAITKSVYEGVKGLTDAMGRIQVIVGEGRSGSSFTRDIGNGRIQIVITPATLDLPPRERNYTIAHELVHGLTLSELNNPTKRGTVEELEKLRLKMIDSLSPKQRTAFDRAMNEDWYGKWSRNEVVWDSLFSTGTNAERHMLYGLLRTSEFVSQGLTKKSMQDFMRRVKGEGKVGIFSQFADKVKSLLGFNVENTAFEDFLGHTGALLEHGDFVSSFRDFSERYFENKGLSDSMVQGQTRRALSLVINSGFGTSMEDVFTQLGNDVSVRSAELNTAKRDLNTIIDKTNEVFPDVEQLMGELGFEPSVKGHDDFVHEALMGREARYSDALDMMPTEAKNYVFAKAKDMQTVLGVLKAATSEWNNGLLNLADPAALRGPIKQAMTAVDRILAVQKVHELGAQLVEESMAMAPDVFSERTANAPDTKVLEDFGNEDPRKPGALSFFLGQMSRMVRRFPVTAELADRVYELGPNAANMKSRILLPMGIDVRSGKQALTKEGLEEATKSISTPKTLKAFNSWVYWNNEIARQEERGATMLPSNHPEIVKVLNKLNPNEQAGVSDMVVKQGLSTQMGHAETLEKMHQIGVALGAKIVMKDAGLKTKESLDLAGQMFDAVKADRSNPQVAQQADAQIAVVQSRMTPEGFLELLKYMQPEIEKFNGWAKYFDANKAWATAQRLERYLVQFTRGKEKKNLQASSIKEANKIAEGGQHLEIIDQWKNTEDDFPILGPDADAWFQRARELEDNQLRSMVSKGYLDQAGADEFMKMSPVTQQQRETAAHQSGIPRFQAPPRLLSQGADELPWFWNHVAHAERISNFWSRKLLRAQASLHLVDPDMVANPDLQKMMRTHVDNVLKPDPAFISKVSRFVSTWFMGFSPASAMMNGFQTITTAVPELTSINGGRILDSYSKWGKALTEISKKSLPGGNWSTEDHKWFAKKMSEAHEWDFSMYSDESAVQEAAAVNFKRMMMKQKPQDIGQRLGTTAGVYSSAGMWMFKSVERFNNKVASLMAFDHFMGEGMSREDALVEATRFNRAVNYGGGRANRPVGAFSMLPRTVAMLATNMQGYNLGVVGQIADYLQRGFFRPPGITPAEVYSARKAGLQMLATQFAAAGALGLPFVSGVLALLNQFDPDLEVNRHVREWANDFFKGDKENGGTWGDIALTGLPSMLGWDMQSRLSIGNVVPGTSEYNGFQPEALLGPPANLVANFLSGASRIVQGDPKGGESFVPPGVKKLFQYVTNEGQLKDYKDRPLFTPTIGETAGIALGFNPKKLSDFNAASRITEQNRAVVARREGSFHQGLAEEALRGNFGNVRAALLERQTTDKSFDPRTAVRALAQAAEDLTFPRDLRREGTQRTSQARSRLLSTFNLPSSEVSEVDRVHFRVQIEQRLGLRVDPRRELRVAQMVDQLRATNPQATRSELRRQVESLLRRTQTPSLLPE